MTLRTLLFPILVSLALLAGCATSGHQDGEDDKAYLTQRVLISDPELQANIRTQLLEDFRDDGDVYQLNVSNNSPRPMVMNYRVEWFDLNGFVVGEVETGKLRVGPTDTQFIKATPPAVEAEYVRFVLSR